MEPILTEKENIDFVNILNNSQNIFDLSTSSIFENIHEDLKLLNNEAQYSVISSTPTIQVKYSDIDNNIIGRFCTDIHEFHYECYLKIGKVKRLYVMFNGARKASKKSKFPNFSRWSWFEKLNACVLCIEDPMYYKYPKLKLGWYYGNKEISIRQDIVELVNKIAKIHNICDEDIIFYGSSGGGTVAIHCANLYKNCNAVAINPQLDFTERHENNIEFERITNISLLEDDKFHRNDFNFILSNSQSSTLLIENVRSRWDMRHLSYISQKLGIAPSLGVNSYRNKNIIVWLYQAQYGKNQIPHNAFEDINLFYFIDLLVKLSHVNSIQNIIPMFNVLGNIWYYNYGKENNKLQYNDNYKLERTYDFFTIPSSSSKYNSFQIKDLKCNTRYTIVINLKPYQSIDEISIALFDIQNNEIIKNSIFSTSKEILFSIDTNMYEKNMGIAIYTGLYGQAENKSLKIERINVYTD